MELTPIQYIFMVMTAAAGGFMLMAVRDAVFGQGENAGHAIFLAGLSAGAQKGPGQPKPGP